jgi:hypothetical protein
MAGTTCIQDARVETIRGRKTKFRILQHRLMDCAFEDFLPGGATDPDRTRPFLEYRDQAIANLIAAGKIVFGSQFELTSQQKGKVDGDIFEILEAAALWNAMAAWNAYMDTGVWNSDIFECPPGAVATPTRKVAVVKLPRGYNATGLFNHATLRDYEAFESALSTHGMELKLSSPDIVGIRVPHPMPAGYETFLHPLANLKNENRQFLEAAYSKIEGTLDARSFLFAIAVKTSTRSDRLYQPLFEANVLKFIIGFVLRGGAFKFHVHMESMEGANVEGRYKAASLTALMLGGAPTRAIDVVYNALMPIATAQSVLNDLPTFPL